MDLETDQLDHIYIQSSMSDGSYYGNTSSDFSLANTYSNKKN